MFDEFIMGLAINLVLECIPAYTNACVMARLELTELKNRLIVSNSQCNFYRRFSIQYLLLKLAYC